LVTVCFKTLRINPVIYLRIYLSTWRLW